MVMALVVMVVVDAAAVVVFIADSDIYSALISVMYLFLYLCISPEDLPQHLPIHFHHETATYSPQLGIQIVFCRCQFVHLGHTFYWFLLKFN